MRKVFKKISKPKTFTTLNVYHRNDLPLSMFSFSQTEGM